MKIFKIHRKKDFHRLYRKRAVQGSKYLGFLTWHDSLRRRKEDVLALVDEVIATVKKEVTA